MKWNWDFIRGHKTEIPNQPAPTAGKLIMVNGQAHEIQEPHLSDMEVAGQVRMLMRDQLDHERVCTLARDRIVYLADRLGEIVSLAAHPAPDAGYVVKPLEWRGPDFEDEYCANALERGYTIGRLVNQGRWLGGVGGYFPSIEAAKAAAQADYEHRIRSALIPQKAEAGYVAGFEAWQWNGDEIKQDDPDWVAEATEPRAVLTAFGVAPFGLKAHTAVGPVNVKPGWWLIKIADEIHVVTPALKAAIAALPAPAKEVTDVMRDAVAAERYGFSYGLLTDDQQAHVTRLINAPKGTQS